MATFKLLVISSLLAAVAGVNLQERLDITWGDGRGKIETTDNTLTLSLDKFSGSGFQSKRMYLYAKIDMQLRLVPGNSAGTVTSYYLSSQGSTHDEIDMEFLGNLTGDPYVLHTNIYTQGKGDREQQFNLWFDPSADFHTYSILWNPHCIVLFVDGRPIREFRNMEPRGLPYPSKQAMRMYSSIWNADDWATRGGLVKIDWSRAPFTAAYRNFNDAYACSSVCSGSSSWLSQRLDQRSRAILRDMRGRHMVYNYCTDTKRFPHGVPLECAFDNYP